MKLGFPLPDQWGGRDPMKGMLAILFLLLGIGMAYLFSASWYFARAIFEDPFRIWRRQFILAMLGSLAGIIVYYVPVSYIKRSVPTLVWVALALNCLTYIPGIGYQSGGARRWIDVAGMTFQPSEFTRITLILYLARMLEKNQEKFDDFKTSILPPLLIVALLILSVYFQNDFSTVTYFIILSLMLFFVSGVPRAIIGILSFSGILAAMTMLMAKSYRLERVFSWLRPEHDPTGTGYQLLKARIALERGGLWGNGIGQGLVKKGGLPSAHSDFVVAVIGEESGLIGIAGILILYTVFAVKGWSSVGSVRNAFSRWGLFGLVTAVYWQVLLNFAVVAGAVPATGIPMPLFSAGGSAIFMTLISFGLIFKLAEDIS